MRTKVLLVVVALAIFILGCLGIYTLCIKWHSQPQEVASGEIYRLQGFAPQYHFTPDSRYLIVPCLSTIGVWDIATQSKIKEFGGRIDYISPNGLWFASLVFTGSRRVSGRYETNRTYEVYRAITGENIGTISNIGNSSFSSNGQWLAGFRRSISSTVYSLMDGEGQTTNGMLMTYSVYDCAIPSPDGRWLVLVAGGSRGNPSVAQICEFDAVNGRVKPYMDLWLPRYEGCAFSPDSRWLAIVRSHDADSNVWDLDTGQKVLPPVTGKLPNSLPDNRMGFAFDPYGRFVVFRTKSKNAYRIWNLVDSQEIQQIEYLRDCDPQVIFSPNGTLLALRVSSSILLVLDTATWKKRSVRAVSLDFSHDGRWLAKANPKGGASLIELPSWRELWSLPDFGADLEFSPNSQWLASYIPKEDALLLWKLEGESEQVDYQKAQERQVKEIELSEKEERERKAISELPRTMTGRNGMEMLLVPAGEFQMGSSDGEDGEEPVHTVYLNSFYIDKHEVTNAQYRRFTQISGHRLPEGEGYVNGEWQHGFMPWRYEKSNNDNQPVVCVSWEDAKAYAEWTGKRLPTEAEWEKAARGGLVGKKYPWGDKDPDGTQCNFADTNTDYAWSSHASDGYGYTAPVGTYPPNRYGLYDMAGNVWEWCADWYDNGYYANSLRRNPKGPSLTWRSSSKGTEPARVLRGGSWYDSSQGVSVSTRFWNPPGAKSQLIGFRCVADITP